MRQGLKFNPVSLSLFFSIDQGVHRTFLSDLASSPSTLAAPESRSITTPLPSDPAPPVLHPHVVGLAAPFAHRHQLVLPPSVPRGATAPVRRQPRRFPLSWAAGSPAVRTSGPPPSSRVPPPTGASLPCCGRLLSCWRFRRAHQIFFSTF